MTHHTTRFETRAGGALDIRTLRLRCKPTIVPLVTMIWAVLVCAGLYGLWCYAQDPGTQEASPIRWPQASRIPRPQDKPILLLFAHPRCPCTRATLSELERLTARIPGRLETYVIFTGPLQMGHDWPWTDLRRNAESMNGAHVFCDQSGLESELFRARTSGLALLYSNAGLLLFQGGLTPSRGHEGDNDGIAAVQAIVLDEGSAVHQTPVFGCPLQIPNQIALQGPVQ